MAVLVFGPCYMFGRVPEAHAIVAEALAGPLDSFGEVALRRRKAMTETGTPRDYLETTYRMARALPTLDLPEWVEPRNSEFLSLRELMLAAQASGDLDEARELCEELIRIGRGRGRLLHQTLAHEAGYHQAYEEGDFERAREFLELEHDDLIKENDERELVNWINSMADLEGRALGSTSRPRVAWLRPPRSSSPSAMSPCLPARWRRWARWSVAPCRWDAPVPKEPASAWRETTRMAQTPPVESLLGDLAAARAAVPPEEWTAAYEEGRASPVVDVLRDLARQVVDLPAGHIR